MMEYPTDLDLARMAQGMSRDRLRRVLADYAAELLDEGFTIDEVWQVIQALCHEIGVDPDEVSRSRH